MILCQLFFLILHSGKKVDSSDSSSVVDEKLYTAFSSSVLILLRIPVRILFALDKSFYTKDFEEQADMLLMGDIPPDDPELGFLDFCYNPSLLCQRFFSPSILEELHAKLEKMKISIDFLEREREIDKIDTWLVDNHFLIYTFHPTKRERIHSMIDRKDSKYHYGHFDLRTVWADGGPVK